MERYSDSDLRAAFVAYNRIKKKVEFKVEEETKEVKGLNVLLRKLFTKF